MPEPPFILYDSLPFSAMPIFAVIAFLSTIEYFPHQFRETIELVLILLLRTPPNGRQPLKRDVLAKRQ